MMIMGILMLMSMMIIMMMKLIIMMTVKTTLKKTTKTKDYHKEDNYDKDQHKLHISITNILSMNKSKVFQIGSDCSKWAITGDDLFFIISNCCYSGLTVYTESRSFSLMLLICSNFLNISIFRFKGPFKKFSYLKGSLFLFVLLQLSIWVIPCEKSEKNTTNFFGDF